MTACVDFEKKKTDRKGKGEQNVQINNQRRRFIQR